MTVSQRDLVRLKVTLDHVKPKVERWLVVPLKIRLDRLHQTLQAAMPWTDSHLWEFSAGDMEWSIPDPEGDMYGGFAPLDARKTTLLQLLNETGVKKLTYVYDFGDGWRHTIKLDRFHSMPVEFNAPFLVEAWGLCPPEDCGGPYGYADLLAALADASHEDHEHALEELGEDYDPSVVPTGRLKELVDELAEQWRPKPRKPR